MPAHTSESLERLLDAVLSIKCQLQRRFTSEQAASCRAFPPERQHYVGVSQYEGLGDSCKRYCMFGYVTWRNAAGGSFDRRALASPVADSLLPAASGVAEACTEIIYKDKCSNNAVISGRTLSFPVSLTPDNLARLASLQ